MKNIFLAILFISLLTNCNNSKKKPVDKSDRMELIPEPDKALKEEYQKKNNKTVDTSNKMPQLNKDSIVKYK